MTVKWKNHNLKPLVEVKINKMMLGKQVKVLSLRKSFNPCSLDFQIF